MTDPEYDGVTPSPPPEYDDSDFELPFDVLNARRRHTPAQRDALRADSRLLPRGGVAFPDEPNRVRPRLAIYLRISHLKEDSISVMRQYRACVAEVRRLGGTFDRNVDIYHDVSVSAAKGAYRAGMEELLARIEDDKAYDGVVIWEFPRALRSYAESLNFRNIFFQGSCELYIVTTPQLRLFGPAAAFFDMHVNVAAGETLAMSERARSRHHYMSILGAARSRPMFGMAKVVASDLIPGRAAPIKRYVPDTEPRASLQGRSPAEMMREAFDLILEGRSARSIAFEWNRENLLASEGVEWRAATIKHLVLTPTIAGLAHRRRMLLGADGEELAPGSTDQPLQVGVGIVGVEEWLQLRAMFARRSYRHVRRQGESLLRGLLKCGRCGQTCSRHGHKYQCADSHFGYLKCGSGNGVQTALVEGFVKAAAIEVLKSRRLRDAAWAVNRSDRSADARRLEDKVADLYRQLDDIEGLWLASTVRDDHARERMARRRATAESALLEAKADLAALAVRTRGLYVDRLYSDDSTVEEAFNSAAPHLQVSVLQELIERVILRPAAPGVWGANRFEIVWATF